MINQPRRRRGATLSGLATLLIVIWLGMVFVARSLATNDKTAGFAAFLGFFVVAMSMVVFAVFMMAVDSDKS